MGCGSVVELRARPVSVVDVLADPHACDTVEAGEATVCRVAPDEVLVVGDGDGFRAVANIRMTVTAVDRGALVLDVTDGWTAWEISGANVRDAFARLSELPVPGRGFVQGEVAHLPAKVLADVDRLTLLVASMWEAALRERILADCAAVGIAEAKERADP
jgi:sarcosine oxidase gamma subunit